MYGWRTSNRMSRSDLVCSTCPLAEITSFLSTFMAYTWPSVPLSFFFLTNMTLPNAPLPTIFNRSKSATVSLSSLLAAPALPPLPLPPPPPKIRLKKPPLGAAFLGDEAGGVGGALDMCTLVLPLLLAGSGVGSSAALGFTNTTAVVASRPLSRAMIVGKVLLGLPPDSAMVRNLNTVCKARSTPAATLLRSVTPGGMPRDRLTQPRCSLRYARR
mmetsp:Transcript_47507/g.83034  ORF Transcript_47507/g.83034 Transcript_47507/m.83034 type:complete len:215 (-) Transcript_47507:486-1130(-)